MSGLLIEGTAGAMRLVVLRTDGKDDLEALQLTALVFRFLGSIKYKFSQLYLNGISDHFTSENILT